MSISELPLTPPEAAAWQEYLAEVKPWLDAFDAEARLLDRTRQAAAASAETAYREAYHIAWEQYNTDYAQAWRAYQDGTAELRHKRDSAITAALIGSAAS